MPLDSVTADQATTVTREQYVDGLRRFAEGGGQLVLTDGALALAADLGLVGADDVVLHRTDAGHVDPAQPLGDHSFEEGLFGKVSRRDDRGRHSPEVGSARGRVGHRVRVGAVQATEEHPHPHALASCGVTIAGGAGPRQRPVAPAPVACSPWTASSGPCRR